MYLDFKKRRLSLFLLFAGGDFWDTTTNLQKAILPDSRFYNVGKNRPKIGVFFRPLLIISDG